MNTNLTNAYLLINMYMKNYKRYIIKTLIVSVLFFLPKAVTIMHVKDVSGNSQCALLCAASYSHILSFSLGSLDNSSI